MHSSQTFRIMDADTRMLIALSWGRETAMIATWFYRRLKRGGLECLYLSCLPFGYVALFLLLRQRTDLPIGMVCAIVVLTGDVLGAVFAGIIVGVCGLVIPGGKRTVRDTRKGGTA